MKKTYVAASLALVVVASACARAPQEAPASAAKESPAPAPAEPAAASTFDQKEADDAAPRSEQAPVAPSIAAEEGPGSEKRKAAADSDTRLFEENRAFDGAMQPTALSCDGARPHRDAICSIAERLCELPAEEPSTTQPNRRCSDARYSCSRAKDKFKARCGG